MSKPSGNLLRPSRPSLALWAVVVACAASGCSGGSEKAALPQAADCSVRVIVRFATAANDDVLAEVERTHSLELEPAGAITNELGAYTLRSVGAAGDCGAAIERLRSDARVRSVDLDARRELHDEQNAR